MDLCDRSSDAENGLFLILLYEKSMSRIVFNSLIMIRESVLMEWMEDEISLPLESI